MTSKTLEPIASECTQSMSAPLQMVQFLKEQYLAAEAARTFLHVLHNRGWDAECERIRHNMRPEIEKLFSPAEQALREGKDCQAAIRKLIDLLKART